MFSIRLFSRIPLPILYVVAWILYVLTYYIYRYRRKVVFNNLKQSFPEKSDDELRRISKGFYKRLAQFGVEAIKGITISREALMKRVDFEPNEILFEQLRNKENVVLMASHTFNWEWVLLAGCLHLKVPIDAVYQPIAIKFFDRLMINTRSRFGGKPVSKNEIVRTLVREKDRHASLSIVADQMPPGRAPMVWHDFLNRKTAFYLGTEKLINVLERPVYFIHTVRVRRGYYQVKFIPLAMPPYPKKLPDGHIMGRFADSLQDLITADPEGWLWSHNRWKRRGTPPPD